MAKLKVPKTLEDGRHNGVITRTESRDEPYKYLDVCIESEGVEIKVGYPRVLSTNSALFALLYRFGAELLPEKEIDTDAILVGKKVTFVSVADDGYAKITKESVKPAS